MLFSKTLFAQFGMSGTSTPFPHPTYQDYSRLREKRKGFIENWSRVAFHDDEVQRFTGARSRLGDYYDFGFLNQYL